MFRCCELFQEVRNPMDDGGINSVLRELASLEHGLRELEGMIRALDHIKLVGYAHARADLCQAVERTKRIARALHKQDGCAQRDQDFVAKRAALADEGVAQTDECKSPLVRGIVCEVTTDTTAHALAYEHDRLAWVERVEGGAVGPDENRQTVGRTSTSQLIWIVEALDPSENRQSFPELAHPRRRRRRAP